MLEPGADRHCRRDRAARTLHLQHHLEVVVRYGALLRVLGRPDVGDALRAARRAEDGSRGDVERVARRNLAAHGRLELLPNPAVELVLNLRCRVRGVESLLLHRAVAVAVRIRNLVPAGVDRRSVIYSVAAVPHVDLLAGRYVGVLGPAARPRF